VQPSAFSNKEVTTNEASRRQLVLRVSNPFEFEQLEMCDSSAGRLLEDEAGWRDTRAIGRPAGRVEQFLCQILLLAG
jgi:hypothetical protein